MQEGLWLKDQASPYLLQHAEHPVDWYPWCKEAFAKAKAESKPMFLSIGYSTCHWCHVMARECFQDQEVANELPNRCRLFPGIAWHLPEADVRFRPQTGTGFPCPAPIFHK